MRRSITLSFGRGVLLRAVAIGLSLSIGLGALGGSPGARADDAAQQELDAAIRQLVAALSRAELYLAWYDQSNRLQVAQGRIERTQGMIFSADETADVGIDLGTPVVEAIGSEARSRFSGRVSKVTIEVVEKKE